jgi:hypothetical protein
MNFEALKYDISYLEIGETIEIIPKDLKIFRRVVEREIRNLGDQLPSINQSIIQRKGAMLRLYGNILLASANPVNLFKPQKRIKFVI